MKNKKRIIITAVVAVLGIAEIGVAVHGAVGNMSSEENARNITTEAVAEDMTKEAVAVAEAAEAKTKKTTATTEEAKTEEDPVREAAGDQTQTTTVTPVQNPAAPAQTTTVSTVQTTQTTNTAQAPAATEAEPVHEHTWVTVTDAEAWDEPVYETRDIWELHSYWPDGTICDEMMSCQAKMNWCLKHCTSCFPDCPEPDPQGRCSLSIADGPVYMGTETIQTGTVHHEAVTHQECSTCGARQ